MSELGYTWTRKPMPNQPETIFVTLDTGGEFSISELSKKHGLKLGVIRHRIYSETPVSELFRPARKSRPRGGVKPKLSNADKPPSEAKQAAIINKFWSTKLA